MTMFNIHLWNAGTNEAVSAGSAKMRRVSEKCGTSLDRKQGVDGGSMWRWESLMMRIGDGKRIGRMKV